MGVINTERHSLITVQASSCKVYLRSGDRNSGKPITFPLNARKTIVLGGWLCEAVGSRIYIREAKVSAFKENLNAEFLPCANVEIKAGSGAETIALANGVVSIILIEKADCISVSVHEKTDNRSFKPLNTSMIATDNEMPNEVNADLSDRLGTIKKRLEMDVNSAKAMELGGQVKKGVIIEHLGKADKELSGTVSVENLCRAEHEIVVAEKLMASVIKHQEDVQKRIEKATQTTKKIKI